jgi:hypothetical protein
MNPQALGEAIANFANFLLKYAVVLAAAGALAMAFVELFKKLHDARTRFQARAVTRWFQTSEGGSDRALGELLQLAAGVSRETSFCRAQQLFTQKGKLPGIMWLTSDPRDAAFALELERMVVCFQDSVDLALTSPDLYRNLYEFMTAAASLEDRDNWRTEASQAIGAAPLNPGEAKQRAERYARIRQAATRKLDAFQMFTSMEWVNRQQLWSNLLGTVILGAAFTLVGIKRGDIVFAVLFATLGGMLAPVAKDLVVALQQIRQLRSPQ